MFIHAYLKSMLKSPHQKNLEFYNERRGCWTFEQCISWILLHNFIVTYRFRIIDLWTPQSHPNQINLQESPTMESSFRVMCFFARSLTFFFFLSFFFFLPSWGIRKGFKERLVGLREKILVPIGFRMSCLGLSRHLGSPLPNPFPHTKLQVGSGGSGSNGQVARNGFTIVRPKHPQILEPLLSPTWWKDSLT